MFVSKPENTAHFLVFFFFFFPPLVLWRQRSPSRQHTHTLSKTAIFISAECQCGLWILLADRGEADMKKHTHAHMRIWTDRHTQTHTPLFSIPLYSTPVMMTNLGAGSIQWRQMSLVNTHSYMHTHTHLDMCVHAHTQIWSCLSSEDG